ncbi:MAG: UDP-N-acetylmuramoyl-L-alanine--D-glutamate ligase [Candidatus Dormibacteria bacterium]
MSVRTAVVLGLGRSGLACARTLSSEGFRVRVVDRADTEALRSLAATLGADVDVQLGGYDDDVAAGADLVCPSPGVPWDAPELEAARRHHIPIRSELALVFERCPARIVGITGTNGKTTTSSLTANVLARTGVPTHLGGNIGSTVLDRLDAVRTGDWLVLELSSYQIESIAAPRCHIGAVLNVTPDHLDRHGSLAAYAGLKRRLVEHSTEAAVLGFDDALTRDMAGSARAPLRAFGSDIRGHDGATVRGGEVVSIEAGEAVGILPVEEIPLFGDHNVANVLAAVCMARVAGTAAQDIAAAVREYRPPHHRLEPVMERDGVLWVDDSKATNDEAARRALGAFGDRPIVWIGGGRSKGVDPTALVTEVVGRVQHAVLIGDTAEVLDAALAARGFTGRHVAGTLPEAVARARELASPGAVVLLAPGYASFDQFTDFEERGRVFTALVTGDDGAAARSLPRDPSRDAEVSGGERTS